MAQAVRILGADGVKDLEHFQPPDPEAGHGPGDRRQPAVGPDSRRLRRLSTADSVHAGGAGARSTGGRGGALAAAGGELRLGGRSARRAAGHRQQQLDRRRQPDADGLSHDGERPPSRAAGALAALLGPPRRAGLGRHRRRRAGAAGRVDRPQPARRLGAHRLRQRQRGPVRLRHEPHQPARVPGTGARGSRCVSSRTPSRSRGRRRSRWT